jgi:DNA-binding MarR family transcriptional regulator
MPTILRTPLPPDLERDADRLAEVLQDLIRVVQFRDRDRACCYDVSVSQCYALAAVTDLGPLTVNELAAHLYLDKSTSSRLAAGLEAKGYVTRERAPDDGRVIHLVVTPPGRALRGRIADDLVRTYADLLTDFEPEVRTALIRLVERLGASFAARVQTSGGSCCVVE